MYLQMRFPRFLKMPCKIECRISAKKLGSILLGNKNKGKAWKKIVKEGRKKTKSENLSAVSKGENKRRKKRSGSRIRGRKDGIALSNRKKTTKNNSRGT